MQTISGKNITCINFGLEHWSKWHNIKSVALGESKIQIVRERGREKSA
jgi:hypothetical protein